MGKMVNLSFKVPEDIHKKLKVISALSGKHMSEIIIDFVKKQKVSIPTFDNKPEKTKPTKTVKTGTRKDQKPNADEESIKTEILKHKKNGLSLQKIAHALNEKGIPTLRGGSEWAKGTIDGLLRKWAKQDV
jgi:hypothetical protein